MITRGYFLATAAKAAVVAALSVGASAYAQSIPVSSVDNNSSTENSVPAQVPQETADAPGSPGLSDIVVTAERFKSTVQTTPVAISAFTPESLKERQINNVLQIATQVPGIVITKSIGSGNSSRIILRGAGQENSGINYDPAVGIYIDNVYQPRLNGGFFDFFDIGGVEVLRGPQGTLYGRNTSGGAIKITTMRPSTDKMTYAGDFAIGTYGTLEARGYVSGPISDTLAVSISAVARKRDGTIYAPAYSRKVNNVNTSAFRGKVLWHPSEKFEVEAALDYQRDLSDPGMGIPLQVGVGVNDPAAVPGRSLSTTELFGPIAQRLWSVGGSINARYFLSPSVTISSITGARDLYNHVVNPYWLTAAAIASGNGAQNLGGGTHIDDKFVSQEFNVTLNTDKIKGVAGLFYFYEHGFAEAELPYSTPNDQIRDTTSYAAFIQGTYQIIPSVGVTAGVRYTKEDANFTQFYYTLRNFSQSAAKTFNAFTPKFGIDWQVARNLFAYASYTKGFKSGGYNPISPTTNTGTGLDGAPTAYGPETVASWEAGIKFNTLDHRLRLNLAVFQAKYKGLQLPVLFPGTSNSYTSNASNATIKGIEFEPTWQVSDALQVYSNMSFTTGKYTSPFVCILSDTSIVNCENKHIKGVVPRKITGGFTFTPRLNIPGQLRLAADVDYTSKYYNNVANVIDLVQSHSVAIINGSLGWVSSDNHWSVTLEGKNLANRKYVIAGLQLTSPVRPTVTGFINDPRILDIRVGFKF